MTTEEDNDMNDQPPAPADRYDLLLPPGADPVAALDAAAAAALDGKTVVLSMDVFNNEELELGKLTNDLCRQGFATRLSFCPEYQEVWLRLMTDEEVRVRLGQVVPAAPSFGEWPSMS